MQSEYAEYLQQEWQRFAEDAARARASLDAVGPKHQRILDVGCGAGQELLPFVSEGAFAVGTDLSHEATRMARSLYHQAPAVRRPAFMQSAAERLPFQPASFDVVISRLALPYTDNRRALGEIARVLRPRGTLLLKIHHACYYITKLWHGVIHANLPSAIHAARVLAAGTVYHVTGRQFRTALLSGETFQTRWLLRRELARNGLAILGQMPDSSRQAPAFVVRRLG
jgi:ubiquinone/menaquinone biosynthesis C-methylase UbiE